MGKLRVNILSDKAGTSATSLTAQETFKAWCLHDSSAAILLSFNVTSVTDLGTGQYRPNYTNNMSSANYFSAGGSVSGSDRWTTAPIIAAGYWEVRYWDSSTPALLDGATASHVAGVLA
jgi:hypothetical protein